MVASMGLQRAVRAELVTETTHYSSEMCTLCRWAFCVGAVVVQAWHINGCVKIYDSTKAY
jgi:hypothetical protein